MMDYFFKTQPKDWTFEFALLHYANKLDGNIQLAARNMKNDLQTIISSNLVAKRATDIMRGYYANFDVSLIALKKRVESCN